MDYETIRYAVSDLVLIITLNRPEKLNAFSSRMMLELIDAIDRANADDDVRAIIVTGEGRAFCAGADLSGGRGAFDYLNFADRAHNPGSPIGQNGEIDWRHEAIRDSAGRVTLRIFDCLKPVIGAINGPAVAQAPPFRSPWTSASPRRQRASDMSSAGAASCLKPAQAGSCPASSASAGRWNGRCRGACSEPRRRSSGGWCVRCTRRRARGRCARHRPRDRAQRGPSVGGAAPPNDVEDAGRRSPDGGAPHRQHGRVRAGPVPRTPAEGATSFLEKRPARFTDAVSRHMPSFYPWWSARSFQ